MLLISVFFLLENEGKRFCQVKRLSFFIMESLKCFLNPVQSPLCVQWWHLLSVPPGACSASGWMDEWVDIWKVNKKGPSTSHFNIYWTLSYYILKYIKKNCPDKFLVDFKFWSSWGSECKILKLPFRIDFFSSYQKSIFKFDDYFRGLLAKNFNVLLKIYFFSLFIFKEISCR